jgi:hypothetical protein
MHGVGDDDFLTMIRYAYICLLLNQDRLRMRFHFRFLEMLIVVYVGVFVLTSTRKSANRGFNQTEWSGSLSPRPDETKVCGQAESGVDFRLLIGGAWG